MTSTASATVSATVSASARSPTNAADNEDTNDSLFTVVNDDDGGGSSNRLVPEARRTRTAIRIPCCLCGTRIVPNGANQCGPCLARQFDLNAVLRRGPGGAHDIVIQQCRRCRRYGHPAAESHFSTRGGSGGGGGGGGGGRYHHYEPESPELLSLCLRHIPALQHGNRGGGDQFAKSAGVIGKIHVADAMWVWTEPHSMRLKIRLTVRTEVGGGSGGGGGGGVGGVVVQQRILVEFVVRFSQCPECNREFTNRTWHALVQLRQKRANGSPKKGLILLEAALHKNADVRKHVLRMETTRNGFDFYFWSIVHARTFATYLSKACPMRIRSTQQMVSSDVRNNTANMKHTITCDLVPLCRDDLLIVDKHAGGGGKGASGGGSGGGGGGGGVGTLTGRVCLVSKVSGSVVRLVDASPARSASIGDIFADLPGDKYWRGGEDKSYRTLFTSDRMVRFVVLDVEMCDGSGIGGGGGASGGNGETYKGPESGVSKYALADVEVARESDFGQSDTTYRCVSHLGNLLQVGDVVLGYDLANAVLPSDAEWSMDHSLNSSFVVPDVILVKKAKNGGHAASGDVVDGDGDGMPKGGDGSRKDRAKSSGSKRRERRRKKEEKKLKELEDAASRMGFLERGNEEEEEAMGDYGGGRNKGDDLESSSLERDRSAFEMELKNDPDLVRELEMAEKELARIQKDEGDEEEEEDVDDNDDDDDDVQTKSSNEALKETEVPK